MAEYLRNTPSLHIDNILSAHPELGPSVPDGGYGWVILAAIIYFEAIIPNLLLGLGVSLMFSRLETSVAKSPVLDDILIFAPIFFMVARCITEPSCRILIKNSVWPRVIATCGTCLTSAGVFLIWMERLEYMYRSITLIFGGMLCGIGYSLLMCQCDIIITQYFKLKLQRINLIRQLINAIGFIATPIILGNGIINQGVTHATLWYAVVILQGVVASIFLRKPNFYNQQPKVYNLVERTNSLEDEYNIFDKTENAETVNYQVVPSNTSAQDDNSTSVQIHANNNNSTTAKREGWETFDDENEEEEVTVVQPQLQINTGQDSTAESSSTNNLDRIDLDENGRTRSQTSSEIPPSPIFGPLQQESSNNMYSFDDDLGLRQTSRSIYSQNSVLKNTAGNSTYGFILYPTFYKSLLQIITTRFSMFVFMVLFPSHIFEQTKEMTKSSAVYLVGYVGIASMLYIILKVRKSSLSSAERAVLLWFSCWIGCVGYLFVMAIQHETIMLIGGILIVISLNILTYIGEPLLLISPKGETNKIHASLSVLCGLMFLIFLFLNITFKTWFLIMAFMLFSTGCVWFANFYYKKTVALY